MLKLMLIWFGVAVIIIVLISAVRLLLLRNDIDSFKQYWINLQSVRPDNSLTYIALGDSGAQGLGASEPSKGYVGLIATSLSEKYKKPVTVLNISVTGAKIRDAITVQLPQLKKMTIKPDSIVTIDIGANDLQAYDKDRFRADLEELYNQLPKQAVVADIPYFGGGRYNKRERQAVEASGVVHEIAQKYGLRVAQLHEITKQRDSPFIYAADFFHPNNRGYRNWFSAFWQVLNP